MTLDQIWHCLGCGMRDIAQTFERCPKCWKDKPIMPKISATSGPSDIHTMSDEVAEDPVAVEPVAIEQSVTATEDVNADALSVEIVSAMQVPQDVTESVTEPDTANAPADVVADVVPETAAPAVEPAMSTLAPSPVLDVPFSLPTPTKDASKNG